MRFRIFIWAFWGLGFCENGFTSSEKTPENWTAFAREKRFQELENLLLLQDSLDPVNEALVTKIRRCLLLAMTSLKTRKEAEGVVWIEKAQRILESGRKDFTEQEYMQLFDNVQISKFDLFEKLKRNQTTTKGIAK
jgi:hypothetical protein